MQSGKTRKGENNPSDILTQNDERAQTLSKAFESRRARGDKVRRYLANTVEQKPKPTYERLTGPVEEDADRNELAIYKQEVQQLVEDMNIAYRARGGGVNKNSNLKNSMDVTKDPEAFVELLEVSRVVE